MKDIWNITIQLSSLFSWRQHFQDNYKWCWSSPPPQAAGLPVCSWRRPGSWHWSHPALSPLVCQSPPSEIHQHQQPHHLNPGEIGAMPHWSKVPQDPGGDSTFHCIENILNSTLKKTAGLWSLVGNGGGGKWFLRDCLAFSLLSRRRLEKFCVKLEIFSIAILNLQT